MTPEPLWFCLTACQRKFILSKIDDPRQFDADLQQLIFGTGGLVQAPEQRDGTGFRRILLNPLVLKSVGLRGKILPHCAIMSGDHREEQMICNKFP